MGNQRPHMAKKTEMGKTAAQGKGAAEPGKAGTKGAGRLISGKSILLVARSEYARWLSTPRLILLAVAFLPLRDNTVLPLLEASRQMGSPLNLLEPCIATMNSWMGLLLFGLVYLVLMSPFPKADGNMLFYVARMGKRNWILGEMLFQLICAALYSLAANLLTMAQAAGDSFLDNGWSLVVTEYDEKFAPEWGHMIKEILPPNLYFQMPPYMAFLLSYAMFTLFLLLCGMAFMAGCLYQRWLLLFFVQAFHITAGSGLILLRSEAMWFFPVSHALLACHYRKYFRAFVFSPWLSVGLLAGTWLLLAILMYRKARNVSIDMIGGDVLP